MSLQVAVLEQQVCPFEYCLFSALFSPKQYTAILAWLKAVDHWMLVRTDFYEQFEFCIDDVSLPSSVSFLHDTGFREEMCELVCEWFGGLPSDKSLRLIAHRLVRGQRVAIHNDVVAGGETHRLIVQFNDGFRDSSGGYFMLFNSSDPKDIYRILRPLPNSGIAFAVSEKSNHAVSMQHDGTRYTLIFNFK